MLSYTDHYYDHRILYARESYSSDRGVLCRVFPVPGFPGRAETDAAAERVIYFPRDTDAIKTTAAVVFCARDVICRILCAQHSMPQYNIGVVCTSLSRARAYKNLVSGVVCDT